MLADVDAAAALCTCDSVTRVSAILETHCTWGASLSKWEYLWSPRIGQATAKAMWTLIWCFAPVDKKNEEIKVKADDNKKRLSLI